VLTRLTELKHAQAKDDYSANAFLRQKMRVGKRKDREKKDESEVNREEVKAAKVGFKTPKIRLLEVDCVPPEGAGFRTLSRSSSGRSVGGPSNRSERSRKSAALESKREGSVCPWIPRDVERGASVSRRGDMKGQESALLGRSQG